MLVFWLLAICTSKPVLAESFLTDAELVDYVTASSDHRSLPDGTPVFLNIRVVLTDKVQEFADFVSIWFKEVRGPLRLSLSEAEHSLHLVLIPDIIKVAKAGRIRDLRSDMKHVNPDTDFCHFEYIVSDERPSEILTGVFLLDPREMADNQLCFRESIARVFGFTQSVFIFAADLGKAPAKQDELSAWRSQIEAVRVRRSCADLIDSAEYGVCVRRVVSIGQR